MEIFTEGEGQQTHPGITDQMDLMKDLYEGAKSHGLEIEVICWALKYMQEDPSLEPYEAFSMGYQEWIK